MEGPLSEPRILRDIVPFGLATQRRGRLPTLSLLPLPFPTLPLLPLPFPTLPLPLPLPTPVLQINRPLITQAVTVVELAVEWRRNSSKVSEVVISECKHFFISLLLGKIPANYQRPNYGLTCADSGSSTREGDRNGNCEFNGTG